jgi:hypothetical protein
LPDAAGKPPGRYFSRDKLKLTIRETALWSNYKNLRKHSIISLHLREPARCTFDVTFVQVETIDGRKIFP